MSASDAMELHREVASRVSRMPTAREVVRVLFDIERERLAIGDAPYKLDAVHAVAAMLIPRTNR